MTITPNRNQATTKSIEAIVKEQTIEKLLDDVREKPTLVNLLAFLRHQNDCIIRWNELKRFIETNDAESISSAVAMDPTLADVFLADKWKINAPSKRAEHCLKAVALENAFNPVYEYFESLRCLELPKVTDEQLADCFGFHIDDNLSIELMRLHLRACANRGINPGEKMDSLLIIQGEQGNGKSTAIETLSPEFSWYDETTRMSFDSKDSLSSLNSAFIYEFSEIEKILTTFDVAQFKSWITRKVDKYVEKYESISKDHPRRCCLFGTTNASTFLMDPTGARRFLICENTKPANITLLQTLRDAIWKQSLNELEDGLPHYLTNDSQLHIQDQKRAENATVSDPWEAELSSFLSNCKAGEFVTSQQLLKNLNKPVDKLDMRDCRRIGNIMKRMKWEKGRRRQIYHANPVDGYIKPEPEVLTDEQAEAILND
jgi:putative DNA primase/helicase